MLFNITSDLTTCPCFDIAPVNITEGTTQYLMPIILRDPEYTLLEQMVVRARGVGFRAVVGERDASSLGADMPLNQDRDVGRGHQAA